MPKYCPGSQATPAPLSKLQRSPQGQQRGRERGWLPEQTWGEKGKQSTKKPLQPQEKTEARKSTGNVKGTICYLPHHRRPCSHWAFVSAGLPAWNLPAPPTLHTLSINSSSLFRPHPRQTLGYVPVLVTLMSPAPSLYCAHQS